MKKTFLLFCLVLCFASISSAQFWKKAPAEKSGDLFGNQTINIGDSEEDGKKNSDGELVNESEWNFDTEGLGMLMPNQAPRAFMTSPISIGTTYKFSEAFHLNYKYVSFEVEGGMDTKWKAEHHLVGFGFRKFFNQNSMQFVATVGSGMATLKETSGQVDLEKYEAPIWADVSFFWVIDNFSFGPRFSFVEVDTKSESAIPVKGGYSFIGLAVQFGIPGI